MTIVPAHGTPERDSDVPGTGRSTEPSRSASVNRAKHRGVIWVQTTVAPVSRKARTVIRCGMAMRIVASRPRRVRTGGLTAPASCSSDSEVGSHADGRPVVRDEDRLGGKVVPLLVQSLPALKYQVAAEEDEGVHPAATRTPSAARRRWAAFGSLPGESPTSGGAEATACASKGYRTGHAKGYRTGHGAIELATGAIELATHKNLG